MRRIILIRDLYRCRYCRRAVTMDTANIDHVRPWKRGGRTALDNLVAVCWQCNKFKGNRLNVAPLAIHNQPGDKHRRSGCRKPSCHMRHHGLGVEVYVRRKERLSHSNKIERAADLLRTWKPMLTEKALV